MVELLATTRSFVFLCSVGTRSGLLLLGSMGSQK